MGDFKEDWGDIEIGPPEPTTEPADGDELHETYLEVTGRMFDWTRARHDDETLKRFVLDYLAGKIFLSVDINRESLIPMVFLPIALGCFGNMTKETAKEVGVVWEYMSEALPTGINGYPCFGSCRIMHRDDWQRARAAIIREQERQQDIEV